MAYFSEDAKKKIIALNPAAAAWLNQDQDPQTDHPAQRAGARGKTPNKYAGPCQACHGHVAAGEGVLGGKIGGKFVIYHADGTCPDKTTTAQDSPARTQRPATPNKFAGSCMNCGRRVQAGEGVLAGSRGAWKVAHHDGTCLTTAPEPAAEATGGERIELTEQQIANLPIGYYTVDLDKGGHRTFRIRIKTQGQRNAGLAEICYLAGPDNHNDYWLLGVITDTALVTTKPIQSQTMRNAIAVLLDDPAAAQLGYSMHSGNCGRCGRMLTTPESIAIGKGPECMNK